MNFVQWLFPALTRRWRLENAGMMKLNDLGSLTAFYARCRNWPSPVSRTAAKPC